MSPVPQDPDPADHRDQPGREPDPAEQDAAWQEIVEHYGEHPDFPATPPPRRTSEYRVDLPDPTPAHGGEAFDAEDEELHYRPPPPPPVRLPRGPRLAAWTGLFVPPVLLVVFLITGVTINGWIGFVMFAGFLSGFGYLVWHMRRREDDDPWDDGAVV